MPQASDIRFVKLYMLTILTDSLLLLFVPFPALVFDLFEHRLQLLYQ